MDFVKKHWKLAAAIAVGMLIESQTDAAYTAINWVKAKLAPKAGV